MGGGASYIVGFAFDGDLENHFHRSWEVSPEEEISPEISRMADRWNPETGEQLDSVLVIDQKQIVKKAIKREGFFFKEGVSPEVLFQEFMAHSCSSCLACWSYDDDDETTWPKNRTDHSCGDLGPNSVVWDYLPRKLFGFSSREDDGLWDSGYKLKLNLEYCGNARVWYSRLKDFPTIHVGDADHIDLSRLGECEDEAAELRERIVSYGLEVPPLTVSMVIYE